MLGKIKNYIHQHSLLTPGATQLVALSGGADSVCLLLALRQLGYNIHAVHCNFHLRAEESNRDEQFCKKLCNQQNITLHLTHFDTQTYAHLHKLSIEMAARELRYDYFEQLRKAINAENIVVAHHQDDNIETMLLNLLRGTGITGLCGIRPKNGKIVRPLLTVTRKQIEQWLEKQNQPYVVDSTNLVPDVKRNKLRLQVIPLLKQINPSFAQSIQQTIDNLVEAEIVLNHAINQSINEVTSIETAANTRETTETTETRETIEPVPTWNSETRDVISISCLKLSQQPSPEQTLFAILHPHGFTGKQVREVATSLSAPVGKTWQSAIYTLVMDRKRLLLGPTPATHDETPILTIPLVPIKITSQTHTINIKECTRHDIILEHTPNAITVNASAIKLPLTLRYTIKGDTFQPFGMKGKKLVSDYLTDRKRTYFQRANQLVLLDALGQIIWLVGERLAQSVAITPETTKIYKIECTKNS